MWNRRAAEQMKHVWTWNISHFSKFLWWVFCMINKSNVYEHKIENSEWRHWTFMRFFYINNSRCYTINRWSISRFKKIRETKQTMRLFLPRRILEMHLKRKHIICQQAELRFSPLEYFIEYIRELSIEVSHIRKPLWCLP